MKIRDGRPHDLEQVNEIYNWHTENGFSTFMSPTSMEQRSEWFKRFGSDRHIFLVAEENDQIAGLACSFAYRGGGVFESTLETSIYLRPEQMGKGVGSNLYQALFERLKSQNVHRVVVGIALPNEGSVALHRKFGFEEIGIFDEYAFYKGAYRSSLWMQKKMISHPNS